MPYSFLTEARIRASTSDEALFDLLSKELQRRLPEAEGDDLDLFLARTRSFPVGLRAMAATYQLDVSLALDDLGWHFANWHHHAYCKETIWALRELEAPEAANIFAEAYSRAQPHWDTLGALLEQESEAFVAWYPGSELDAATLPLTERLWDMYPNETLGLLGLWMPYARKYPERVVDDAAG